MSEPVTLPAVLCKDCRFFVPDGSLCGHDTAILIDFVNGDHKRFRAQTHRGWNSANDCGRAGKFFEPVSPAIIEVHPPADVIPLILHRGDVA